GRSATTAFVLLFGVASALAAGNLPRPHTVASGTPVTRPLTSRLTLDVPVAADEIVSVRLRPTAAQIAWELQSPDGRTVDRQAHVQEAQVERPVIVAGRPAGT